MRRLVQGALPLGRWNVIQLAYGMPGFGKSTLLHDLVRSMAKTHRFFVMDNEAGWGPDGIHWRGTPPPITIIQGEDQLEHLASIHADEFPDSGVFVFRNIESDAVAELAVAKGNVTYVNDELDKVGKRKGWETSSLRRIVHEGRHLPNENGDICELHILGACRRPQNLHTDLTDLADQVYIFRVKGSRTLQRLLADSMIEDHEWDTIRELPKFHFLHYPSSKFLSVKPVGDGIAEKPPLRSPADESASKRA